MITIFFLLIVFLITFFDNLLLWVIIYITIFSILFILYLFRKIRVSVLIQFVFTIGLLFLSIFIKNNFFQIKEEDKSYSVAWTGVILEYLWDKKYNISQNWNKYILYSKDNIYKPWDKYFLIWKIDKINFIDYKNNFDFHFNLEFDYKKWLFMKWYKWYIYEENIVILWKEKLKKVDEIRYLFKSKILQKYENKDNAWLLMGMLIWDKSYIPEQKYEQFMDSWLVHIVAVSGGNIMMIVIFLSFALFFIPYYFRLIIIISFISFYSILCWLDSSVFRAWVMGTLSLVALFFWRKISIIRLIKYSIFVLLIINPYFLVYDIWFLLSYFALLWIILIDKSFWYIKKIKIIWKSLWEYVLPTFGASLGVFPIIMFFIWRMNLLNIFANIIVVPLVPFVMIYGFISIFLPDVFIWLEDILLSYIYKVSEFFSENGIYLLNNS